MHVLLIPSEYPDAVTPTGGIFFRDQAQALHRNGAQVGVVYPRIFGVRNILKYPWTVLRTLGRSVDRVEDGVRTLRFTGWGGRSRLFLRSTREMQWVSLAEWLVGKYVSRWGRPDIIHAHCALWGGVAARRAAERFGVPYLVTEHSTSFARKMILPEQEPFLRETYEGASRLLTVSESLGGIIEPYAGGKKATTMPNVVDTGYFCPPTTPKNESPFRIFNLSYLKQHKRQADLVRAFARAFTQGEDVLLEIGGDGPEKANIQQIVRTLGVGDRVHLLGALSRDEVRAAMQRAHAFVLPSWVETFGVVLIEAMASGLPVIATRSGGPEEFVSGDVGYLCPVNEPDALAKNMLALYKDRKSWSARSAQIRAYAETNFSYAAVSDRLFGIYREVSTTFSSQALSDA